MIAVGHVLALMVYVVAGGVVARSLASGRATVPKSAVALIVAGGFAHVAALTAYTAHFGELPLVGLGPSLSTLALLIALALVFAFLLREVRPVALVLVPIIALLTFAALLTGIAPSSRALEFRGAWFTAHVVLAFVGYAGLALAFAAGLLYLLQFRALKGKHFGRAFRFFPSLETLDRLGRRSLILSWPLLSIALALGWAWTVRFKHSLAMENPQVIWGVVTWLVFGGAIAVRFGAGSAERRGALATVVGFVVVVLAYFVLRLSMAGGRVFL